MSPISPEQNTSACTKVMQKIKENLYEDHDPVVLKCVVKLLQYKKIFKYGQIILVCFHAFAFIYSTQGKFRNLYNTHMDNPIVKFVDCLSNGMLAATNILGLISFSNTASLYSLIFDIIKSKSSNIDDGSRKCRLGFKRSMLVLHVVTVLSLLFLLYFFIFKIGWNVYQYLVARDLEYYCFNLLVYAVLSFVHKIHQIFQDINQLLLEIDQEFFVSNSNLSFNVNETNINSQHSPKHLERLKSITQYHNNICNLLDKYNDSFKTVLVLFVVCVILDILWDCTVMIEFAVKPKTVEGVETRVYVYILYPLLMMITIGQAALAALVGEHLASEGQKTTVLCYSLLNKLPTHLETEDDKLVEKQINLLLDQSRARNVSLHAGGFFKLDWGILGSIASTVATYSIVIIQFLLPQSSLVCDDKRRNYPLQEMNVTL